MRKLTEYEKKKWFDGSYFSLSEGEFLSYGDELGEAYSAVIACTTMRDYGLSDEFVSAAQVQALDMYYYQVHLYTGEYGGYDTAEDLGLPPLDDFYTKVREIIFRDKLHVNRVDHLSVDPDSDAVKEAFDWAMDWREEHWTEFIEKQRADRLREELARLENG